MLAIKNSTVVANQLDKTVSPNPKLNSAVPPISQIPTPVVLKDLSNASKTQSLAITFHSLSLTIPPGYYYGYLGSTSLFAIDPRPIPQRPDYGEFTSAFNLEILPNKTLDAMKQTFLTDNSLTNKETTIITIANHTGLKTKAIIPPGQGGAYNLWHIYLVNGQDIYDFSSEDMSISANDQQKYFYQILSTFQFTDQNQITPTSPLSSTP